MFVEIVRQKDMDGRTKTILETIAKIYEQHLPDSLSMNHYELAEQFGFTSKQWNLFLKDRDINHMIESEMANIAEIGARKALENLQSGKVASADIQAAKEILANSRILKQKTNQRPQVVLTRIPDKEGIQR